MIRLLCVGLGGMGRHDWSSAAKVPEFKLVAGVDVQEEARAHFQQETGCPTFADFSEALRQTRADAALIAVPDAFHAPYSIQAMEAGLDVICEKPMAETMDDARRMHATAERLGRMLMLHQQLRWTPGYTHLKRLIESGEIGALDHLEFDMFVFSNICLSGYRSRLPQLMLQDLAIHHFDLMRFLSGRECERIEAWSWKAREEGRTIPATTNVYALIAMQGGVRICYRSGIRALLDPTGYGARVEATGTRGSVRLEGDANRLRLLTFRDFEAKKTPRDITPEPPTRNVWESFADAIRTRRPTLTSSGDNLRSLEMLFAAIRSVETGEPVRIGS